MEKILDLVKIFFEKHLIPTVLSVIGAILSIAYLPKDNWMIIRLGDLITGVLVFCAYFVIIEFIIWIANFIKKQHIKNKSNRRRIEQNIINNKETLELLWGFVDNLSPDDYDCLIEFIKTNNQPVERAGEFGGHGCLFASNCIVSTVKKPPTPENEKRDVKTDNGLTRVAFPNMIYTPAIKQYKLKDDFFEILKYSFTVYGGISHFDREEQNND